LHGLQRASFGEIATLRTNPRIKFPNAFYLLRETIALLVGIALCVLLAVICWRSAVPRSAAL
jgi:hypothetical protein